SSFLLPASQGHRLSLIPALTERHLGPSENEFQATKDFTHPSVHIAGEDFGQSTPTRKRKV
ncbi:tesmin/TSO1-like CXC domain protein, partial [Trifolium medium]|nr:tesmin/TSO1-like CXC domain protein [Trifolium medium]